MGSRERFTVFRKSVEHYARRVSLACRETLWTLDLQCVKRVPGDMITTKSYFILAQCYWSILLSLSRVIPPSLHEQARTGQDMHTGGLERTCKTCSRGYMMIGGLNRPAIWRRNVRVNRHGPWSREGGVEPGLVSRSS